MVGRRAVPAAATPAGWPDSVDTTLGILDLLGLELPTGRAIVARHQRQADELNRQRTEQYRPNPTTRPARRTDG
ncbi:hypothetical protein [Micromonospora psammae]|uniref:hypothetical protein n=1 Tax=Micromonospora sp. CPCC 205556 TaxID=3122398 RepID=UPI002FEEEAD5